MQVSIRKIGNAQGILVPKPIWIGLAFQGKTGLVLLDQVRTHDKARLVKRLGAVHPATLQKLLTTMEAMFAPG